MFLSRRELNTANSRLQAGEKAGRRLRRMHPLSDGDPDFDSANVFLDRARSFFDPLQEIVGVDQCETLSAWSNVKADSCLESLFDIDAKDL
jgi:hypothetical protein